MSDDNKIAVFHVRFQRADCMPHEVVIVEALAASLAKQSKLPYEDILSLVGHSFCCGMGVMQRRAEIAAVAAGANVVAGTEADMEELCAKLSAANEVAEKPSTLN